MSTTMVENGVHSDYRSPLATRYVSKEMRYNFSDQHKFSTWRKLWSYLAKAEMFEERGICNEAGNVEIKKVYLPPVKPTKSLVRLKQSKIMDKRSTTTNGRAIKAVSENVKNNPNCLLNTCTFEQCQLHNLARPSNLLMEFRNGCRMKPNCEQAWDANGNLGNTYDQSLLYEDLKKNYVQHQQSMILPPISTFLRKRRGPKSFKVNEAQRYSNEAFARHQILVNNASDASLINNYALNNPCSCRLREKNSIPGNMYLDWNAVQNLMSKVSRVLLMPNENDRQILLANDVDNAANIAASQALVHPNCSFTNHYRYGNYCQNYSVNSIGQNDAMTVHLPDQIPAQCNAYDVRASMLKPSREHLSQQFLSGNMNSVVLGQNADWCYSSSIPDQLSENRDFPDFYNGNYYQTNASQNAQAVTYYDKEISRGSTLSTTSNFEDPYACKPPAKSSMFGNDDIFCGNKQSIGGYIQSEERYAMRPILKVTNADAKVNY